MTDSLILLSGGLDSVTNLFLESKIKLPKLAVLFNYGQRAFKSERGAAQYFSNRVKVPLQIIELPMFNRFKKNALINRKKNLPEEMSKQSAEKVWVPNRNGVMINIAAAIAEENNWNRIIVGFNQEEAETFPDNSLEFINACNESLRMSTKNHVEVFSHTIHWTKERMVSVLRDLEIDFPFSHLWSCYAEGPKTCGKCESCLRLNRALASSIKRS